MYIISSDYVKGCEDRTLNKNLGKSVLKFTISDTDVPDEDIEHYKKVRLAYVLRATDSDNILIDTSLGRNNANIVYIIDPEDVDGIDIDRRSLLGAQYVVQQVFKVFNSPFTVEEKHLCSVVVQNTLPQPVGAIVIGDIVYLLTYVFVSGTLICDHNMLNDSVRFVGVDSIAENYNVSEFSHIFLQNYVGTDGIYNKDWSDN